MDNKQNSSFTIKDNEAKIIKHDVTKVIIVFSTILILFAGLFLYEHFTGNITTFSEYITNFIVK